jgi:hypothetical protein
MDVMYLLWALAESDLAEHEASCLMSPAFDACVARGVASVLIVHPVGTVSRCEPTHSSCDMARPCS